MYEIKIAKKISKSLKKIPRGIATRIDETIVSLIKNPFPCNALRMIGYDNRYRIRTGDYRIVYDVNKDEIFVQIIAIAHRSSVYKEVKR